MQNLDVSIAAQFIRDLPEDAAREIMDAFADDVIRLTHTMSEASKSRDSVTYRIAAHSLAGVAGTFGALHLEGLARQAMTSISTPPLKLMAPIEHAANTAVCEMNLFALVCVSA